MILLEYSLPFIQLFSIFAEHAALQRYVKGNNLLQYNKSQKTFPCQQQNKLLFKYRSCARG